MPMVHMGRKARCARQADQAFITRAAHSLTLTSLDRFILSVSSSSVSALFRPFISNSYASVRDQGQELLLN